MDKNKKTSFYVAPAVKILSLTEDVIVTSGNTYYKFGWTSTEDDFNDYDFE